MRITLNSDYELLIDPDKLHLSVDPVALVESLSEPDLEALTRAVAALCPVLALECALSILREADTAEVLHASLDAAEALRRDLAAYTKPEVEVWDRVAPRPLTPEERERVMAAVSVDGLAARVRVLEDALKNLLPVVKSNAETIDGEFGHCREMDEMLRNGQYPEYSAAVAALSAIDEGKA